MDKTQIIFRLHLPPHQQTAKGLQPGKEPLHFIAPLLAPERPAVLRLVLAVAAMWSNDLNALCSQVGIECIGVIGVVANESLRHFLNEPRLECLLHQLDFMRSSTVNRDGYR